MSSNGNHKHAADHDLSLNTLSVHGGHREAHDRGSAVTPIYQSTTFLQEPEKIGYEAALYHRSNNCPNTVELGRIIAALEGTEAGMVAASGMAAITVALMSFLGSGDHFLVQRELYGGTYDLIKKQFPRFGIGHTEIDSRDPSGWEQLLTPETKVIYVETISNPLTSVADLEAVVEFARRHQLVSMCDNTFASPVICRPAWLGFDIVLESATKYLNGHSDVICGTFAGSKEHVTKITGLQTHFGGVLDPHACFLLQRGMQTLPLRVAYQAETAHALATFLQDQPQVERVHYAGLSGHGCYKRCQKYLGGKAGGVFAFDLHGGDAAAKKLIQALKIPLGAVSLGGTHTLITQPALATHAGMTPEQRKASRISDGTVRVAVGVEGREDLLNDFKQALKTLS